MGALCYAAIDPKLRKRIPTVYTGELHEFHENRHGRLRWRTLDFEFDTIAIGDAQRCAVMNYADLDVEPTRVHEIKLLHPEKTNNTDSGKVIAKEFSRAAGEFDEPYYPINTLENREKLAKYRLDSRKHGNYIFGGCQGSYLYLDMHQAIASALSTFENEV